MVGHSGKDGGAHRVQGVDPGQVADHREGLLAEVLDQGALDLGDAEQVDAAGKGDHLAAVLGGVLDLHGPPPLVAGCPAQGFRPPRVVPYPAVGRYGDDHDLVVAMTQHVQQPAQHRDQAATLARSVALARRQVLLQRRHQEAVATARAVGHRSQLVRVRRQRRRGQQVGPLAWFAVQGKIDQQVVRAVWSDGRLCCDRLLEVRGRLVVELGAEFGSDDPPRRYHASLQAPPVAVLLTLIRTCDLTTVMEVDLGDRFTQHLTIRSPTA
jgi:hypothetical protein